MNNEVQQAVLVERLDHLIEAQRQLSSKVDKVDANLTDKIDKMETQVAVIEKQATFWKGGFFIVLSMGGVLAWVADLWSKLYR